MKTYICELDVHCEREPPARRRGSVVGVVPIVRKRVGERLA
jgi:hypothetical protein